MINTICYIIIGILMVIALVVLSIDVKILIQVSRDLMSSKHGDKKTYRDVLGWRGKGKTK